jgi:hypothetical protein
MSRTPPNVSFAFTGNLTNIRAIYVPVGSRTAYQTANVLGRSGYEIIERTLCSRCNLFEVNCPCGTTAPPTCVHGNNPQTCANCSSTSADVSSITRRIVTDKCDVCGIEKQWKVTTLSVRCADTEQVTVTERWAVKRDLTGRLLQPCSGSMRVSNDYMNVTFANNVIDIFDSTPTVITYSEDTSTVTISSNTFEFRPTAGDIIVLPPDLHFPGGRAIKVVTATTVGNNTRLQIVEPTLDEVFENYEFNTTFEPDVEQIVELFNARQAAGIGTHDEFTHSSLANRITPTSIAAHSSSEPFSLILDRNGSISLRITDFTHGNSNNNITVNGNVNLSFGSIHAERTPTLARTSAVVSIPLTVDTDIAIKGRWDINNPIPLGTVIIPVPMLKCLLIEMNLQLTITASGTIEVVATHTAEFTAGLRYERTAVFASVTPRLSVRNFPLPTIEEINMTSNSTISIQPSFGIRFFSLSMMTLTPTFGIGIDTTLQTSVCGCIDFSVYTLFRLDATLGLRQSEPLINRNANNSPRLNFHLNGNTRVFGVGQCRRPCPTPIITPTGEHEIIQFAGHDWRVLERRDGRMLILADSATIRDTFHNTDTNVTWANSDIRAWLNGSYLNAFNSTDRARIVPMPVVTPNNSWFGTPGGNNTTDHIFLLSIEEVVQYFGDSGQLANMESAPLINGVRWINDIYNDLRVANPRHNVQSGPDWWLRSPGDNNHSSSTNSRNHTAIVTHNGFINVRGSRVNDFNISVRPAMWIQETPPNANPGEHQIVQFAGRGIFVLQDGMAAMVP